MTFPQTRVLSGSQASYNAGTGTITLRIPRSDVGTPVDGTPLYSITAFTATSDSPQSPATVFNLIDAATPFELVVGPPGFLGSTPTLSGNGSSLANLLGCPRATGRLSGRALGPVKLGMKRSRARHLFRWSAGGRGYWDYFCFSPAGIRVGYPSPTLLRGFSRKARRGLTGRIIFALSDNRRYAFKGVRTGTRLTRRLARRLHLARGLKLGPDTWYVLAGSRSDGLLQVNRGVVRAVGIADTRFLTTRRTALRFLNAFR
jgi:hypothetical protein